MTMSAARVPTDPADPTGLAPLTARVHAAFEALIAATRAAQPLAGPHGARLRRPLGRLVATAQCRDIYDQRIGHIATAAAAAGGLDPVAQAAVRHIAARQIADLAALIESAGGTAGECFMTLADLAEERSDPQAGALADLAAAGERIAEDLQRAGAALADLADLEEDRIAPMPGREALTAVDFGWLTALYTMEEERRIHAATLAGAGDDAG